MYKALIQRKEIEDITVTVEMVSNTESHLFGKFGISASINGVYSQFLLLDTEVKDVCNFLLKAETIDELIISDIEEIVKITACVLNLNNWKSVIADVVPILNATLSKEEIDCCTNGDDWFNQSNLWKILQWKAQGTEIIYS